MREVQEQQCESDSVNSELDSVDSPVETLYTPDTTPQLLPVVLGHELAEQSARDYRERPLPLALFFEIVHSERFNSGPY